MILLGGCSINGTGIPGFIHEERNIGAAGELVTTRASGIHFFTDSALGVHIGSIERVRLYPSQTGDTQTCIDDFLNAESNVQPNAETFDQKAVFIGSKKIGSGLEASGSALRFTLGISNRQEIRVASDQNLVMFVETHADNSVRFCAMASPPTNEG